MLSIFPVNTQGLFLWMIKKGFTITNAFQKYLKNLITNQIKYGYIRAANFIIDQ